MGRDKLLRGLEVLCEGTVRFVEALRDTSVDGIFYAVQHASAGVMDRETYKELAEEHDRRILEAAGAFAVNVFHLHGSDIFFDLAESYPVQIVNWHDRDTEPSLQEGWERLPHAVLGGIRKDDMLTASPHELVGQVEEAIRIGSGKGIILGTGCVSSIATPGSNYRSILSAI